MSVRYPPQPPRDEALATLDYQSPPTSPTLSHAWIRAAAIVTLLDLALAIYVGRHVAINGQYGGIYGFNGYARPAIFVSSVVNVAAFFMAACVLALHTSRYRRLLWATFLVHVYVAAIFLQLRYGL